MNKKPTIQQMPSFSNRFGGGNLYAFRDTLGVKRALDETDIDLLQARYVKAKRVRAVKVTAVLKKQLGDIEKSVSSMSRSVFEMMMLIRKEQERKADVNREEEDRCR
ncbi:hypothetical protein L914_00856 [Phytophthora nicotianae]|uniref:Uncharacterized protein n=2 Tax=Phytophthora nicotianae TaxID=4792 RepID=V9G1S9_PHYNI|nr:hypothetical protein F443_00926 [Phytophthora nicotianae P1569]ETM56060.1 hypothetical protein L914_00856 [Phytophthora nicotianae]